MIFRAALLVFGVFACSTAVIMIKESTVAPVPLAGYRLLVATAALSPLFVRDLRRTAGRYGREHLRRTLLPGLLLASHFISWIIGVRMTMTANASLIVNLVPAVMPILLLVLIRERLTRGELAGTAAAMLGVGFLAYNDYHISAERFTGDVICFGSMILFAWYLAMGRRNRNFPSIWLYVVPVYLVGGLICLAAAPLIGGSMAIPSLRDVALVVGLGVIPTVLGHSILNYSMRHIRGQAVSITNLGQFIFAGIMAFFLRSEVPQWTFYLATAFTVSGAVWALRSAPKESKPSEPASPASSASPEKT